MPNKIICLLGLVVLLGGCVSNSNNGDSSTPLPPSHAPNTGSMTPPAMPPEHPAPTHLNLDGIEQVLHGANFTSGVPTPSIVDSGTYESRKKMFERETGEYISEHGGYSELEHINASPAYANGWTGHGQVIAIADSGFSTTHQELTDKTAGLVTIPTNPDSGYVPLGEQLSHGTTVASIAAGNRGQGSIHGVAFDAKLHYTQVELRGGSSEERSISLEDFDDVGNAQFFSRLINPSRESGARINNFSFGVPAAISSFDPEQVRAKLTLFASIIAQTHMYNAQGNRVAIDRDDADKNIIVWSAGNYAQRQDPANNNELIDSSTPTLLGGSALIFHELQKNVLVVVAMNGHSRLADFSNRCGVAKNFCIAAPGVIAGPAHYKQDNAYFALVGGTSYAAPMVSGALAVLRQRFPMLGSHELVARLKATADRTNYTQGEAHQTCLEEHKDSSSANRQLFCHRRDYSDSDTFGVGVLDLGAAIMPVGEMTMSGISLNANSFTPGFSFGDALQSAFSGQLVTGFDQLLTPFEYNLGGFVKTQNPSSLNPLRTFHQDWHRRQNAENSANSGFGAAGFALNSAPEGSSERIFANPNSHLTLAQGGLNFALKPRNGIAFSLFNTAKKDGSPIAAGLSFAWQQSPNFGVGGGVLRENEMALQSRGEGVFGGLNANTFFFGIAAKKQLRDWKLHAGAEAGAVFVDGDYWLDDVSTLLTSSLSADAVKKLNDRNTLRLGISSPLRVEHGDANLTIPAGRTRYRELLHRKITPSLVPTGRQIDLTATWSRKLPFPNARIYASLRNSYQPGHRETADNELSALLSLELDF